jgi:hypothetical protein
LGWWPDKSTLRIPQQMAPGLAVSVLNNVWILLRSAPLGVEVTRLRSAPVRRRIGNSYVLVVSVVEVVKDEEVVVVVVLKSILIIMQVYAIVVIIVSVLVVVVLVVEVTVSVDTVEVTGTMLRKLVQ